MACTNCWVSPPEKKSYQVRLANDKGEELKIVVQTTCIHDMQEWVDTKEFPIENPRVIEIDEEAARHVPIVVNL